MPAVRRCLDCGVVYTAAARRDVVADIYDKDYFSAGYRSYFARSDQWRFEARRRLHWLLAIAQPRRLLEIGCAGGFFVDEARRAGIDARGVEPSTVAARHATHELGVSVTLGAFEEAEPGGPFDAVCAFHVLEHVVEPLGLLEKARDLLAPGGWLALEVPNIESARARREGSAWSNLQPQYHLWHFSRGTLVRLVEAHGFNVADCHTVFQRTYFRPVARPSRAGISNLAHDCRAARSLRSVHPTLGDHIRVLARSTR